MKAKIKIIIVRVMFFTLFLGCLYSSANAQVEKPVVPTVEKPVVPPTEKPIVPPTEKSKKGDTNKDAKQKEDKRKEQEEINKRREQAVKDSLENVKAQALKEKNRIESQEVTLTIISIKFKTKLARDGKEMNKNSWVSISDINIKEDGENISNFPTQIKEEKIKDKTIEKTYGHVVKFKPETKTISIGFTVICYIERTSGNLIKKHKETQSISKYIEFKFNETHQEWEVSYLDRQSNPDDKHFKNFIITDNIGYQDVDFSLNYTFTTEKKNYSKY
jgi:hypothetical protein